jgi:threonine dehydratase
MQNMSVSITDIEAARERIAGAVAVTPCPESVPLSEITGSRIFCKLDNLQRTGSFKERGARNALMQLDDSQWQRGVIAASAGNHALGLSYHGQLLGVPVTVVMPQFAPLVKITTCRRLGAQVVLHGENIADARQRADELAREHGFTYINGFDDPAIIAGQGTMGLEIVEQTPGVDAVVIPIGGAGLIAGVALAVKTRSPQTLVIGVEPENAASYRAACEAGRPVPVAMQPTLADGLAVPQVGARAFALAREHVDHVVSVGEDAIALAILRLAELEKGVVEGAGAAPLAACLEGKLPELKNKTVVLAVAGGNIDPSIFCRVVEKGLVADGRLHRFTAVISDRPGGLARVTQLIAGCDASIKEITHDRTFSGPDVTAVRVLVVVETRDREHIAELHRALRENGIAFTPQS